MENYELKVSYKDWLYIIVIGILFGFLFSLVFYLTNEQFRQISTILFSITSAALVSFLSAFFISLSNKFVLPFVNRKFWYIISFIFSFLAGFLGFFISFSLFKNYDVSIIGYILPYWFEICVTIGLLTFLIGLVLHQFISMKYRHEFSQNQLLKTQIETLESELNPHFLFNALNSISELIYQDKKEAESAVLKLSKFLRNAITQKGLIDLYNELQMVQTYLDIENIRFNDNIKCHITCQEEFYDMLLPKFSIQLLVENAIKHGFTGEVLNIYITVAQEKITVSNDGKKTKKIKFGIGLNNLDRRLALLKIGQLEFESKNNMTFIIQRT